MVRFIHLFSLTKDCDHVVSSESPILPETPYTLVEVLPTADGSDIAKINATYVYGKEAGDYVQFVKSNLNLETIMTCPGDTVLAKVMYQIDQFTDEEKENILESTPSVGSTTDEQLVSVFESGVSSVLFFYDLISQDLVSRGDPFAPFEVCIPPDDQGDHRLNQNVCRYLDYVSKILTCINSCTLGRSWLTQISDFWNIWGQCFPEGKVQDFDVAIFKAISGFACYVSVKITRACEKLEEFDKDYDKFQKAIQKAKTAALEMINDRAESLEKRFSQALMAILATAAPILDAIKTNGAQALADLETKQQRFRQEISDATTEATTRNAQAAKEQSKAIVETLKSHQSQVEASIQGKVSTAVDAVESTCTNSLDQIHSMVEDGLATLEASVSETTRIVNQGQTNLQATATEKIQNISDLGDSTAQNLQNIHSTNAQSLKQFHDNALQTVQTVAGNHLSTIEQVFTKRHRELTSSVSDMETMMTEMMESTRGTANEIRDQVLTHIQTVGEHRSDTLRSQAKNHQHDLRKLAAKSHSDICSSKDRIMSSISEAQEEARYSMETAKDDVIRDVYGHQSEFYQYLDETKREFLKLRDKLLVDIQEAAVKDVMSRVGLIVQDSLDQASKYVQKRADKEVKTAVHKHLKPVVRECLQELKQVRSSTQKYAEETAHYCSRAESSAGKTENVEDRLAQLETSLGNVQSQMGEAPDQKRINSLERKVRKMDDTLRRVVDVLRLRKRN